MKDLKDWLGKGSIDIFGKPLAGKDTISLSLSKLLDAGTFGGGDIMRANPEHAATQAKVEDGSLAPTDEFLAIVLPYFKKPEYEGRPLVLSSVGRMHGEEEAVLNAAHQSGHPIKAMVYINITDDEVRRRQAVAATLGDRGKREDDRADKLARRMSEFSEHTLPVLDFYREHGLLVEVDGMNSREQVMQEVISKLTTFAETHR